jgi:drug/metabolite transporter (DMT)-like permease
MDVRQVMKEAAKPELLLGIACALMLIGSFAPWETLGGQSANALGHWQGAIAFIGGLLLLLGTLVNYKFLRIKKLDMQSPLANAGIWALGSLLGIFGAVTYGVELGTRASPDWGLYLTILAGVLGLFVAYKLYQRGQPEIPRVAWHVD